MSRCAIILPVIAAALFLSPNSPAQLAADTQDGPADNIAFDVATVRQNKSVDYKSDSLFPLGPGDAYADTGGHFRATNIALLFYISFAYKLTSSQQDSIEEGPNSILWEKFDIEAKSDRPGVGKDEMRQMMRSLLADRFKLRMHTETRNEPVFALLLVKPDSTGPQLKPHPSNEPCSATSPPKPSGLEPAFQAATRGALPQSCGGVAEYLKPSTAGYRRAGGRNIGIDLLAKTLSRMGNLRIPVVDRTRLTGSFDFALDWVPDADISSPTDQSAPQRDRH